MAKTGRKKGGKNGGARWLTGKGWCVFEGKRTVRLRDENGETLRKESDKPEADRAYARWLLAEKPKPEAAEFRTVDEVCQFYLTYCKVKNKPTTYNLRRGLLYDFCEGYSQGFVGKKPTKPRIHAGYGKTPVELLTHVDIMKWLAAHKLNGGKSTYLRAIVTAFNFAAKERKITVNPLAGVKVPDTNARITCLTPEQEQALYDEAHPAVALAIRVCIKTGVRYGAEFCQLTSKHVKEVNGVQRWVFEPHETKNGKLRRIRVPKEIAPIVRELIAKTPKGEPLFRNTKGDPWKAGSLGDAFERLKKRLAKKSIELDDAACMYATRHTYAQRFLAKNCDFRKLSKAMGNSLSTVLKFYTDLTERDYDIGIQAILDS